MNSEGESSSSSNEYDTEDEKRQRATAKAPAYKTKEKQKKKRKQKYRALWEQKEEFKLWIGRNSVNAFEAKCKICNVSIKADISVLKLHAVSQKHKRNMEGNLKFKYDLLQSYYCLYFYLHCSCYLR